jgi:hypothetical protein
MINRTSPYFEIFYACTGDYLYYRVSDSPVGTVRPEQTPWGPSGLK